MNTAAHLLEELASAGVSLSRRGDRLHVEANAGTLLPAMRARLTAAKSDLLALLPVSPLPPLPRLLELAAAERLPPDLVKNLPADDLSACAGSTDDELRAYLRALERSEQMARGLVPASYTAAAECARCGPVRLWEGAPARVTACPWCWHRSREERQTQRRCIRP